MDNKNQKHKRRPRYKGTHPKAYQDKYKELQPDKYGDTIEKVLQKGSTPAGMHRSICVNEILKFLAIRPGQNGLDATLGYGGHALEMLKALESTGHLYGIDVDPIELNNTKARLLDLGYGPEILTIRQMNFSDADRLETGPLDFILADLGVSSMQIDNPERGFSFKYDGPLDLRLNPQKGVSAADRLKTIYEDELEGLLIENADEPNAKLIARAIISQRDKGQTILTTSQLQEIIASALKSVAGSKDKVTIKKPVNGVSRLYALMSMTNMRSSMNF